MNKRSLMSHSFKVLKTAKFFTQAHFKNKAEAISENGRFI